MRGRVPIGGLACVWLLHLSAVRQVTSGCVSGGGVSHHVGLSYTLSCCYGCCCVLCCLLPLKTGRIVLGLLDFIM